jgi:hypothetical protein
MTKWIYVFVFLCLCVSISLYSPRTKMRCINTVMLTAFTGLEEKFISVRKHLGDGLMNGKGACIHTYIHAYTCVVKYSLHDLLKSPFDVSQMPSAHSFHSLHLPAFHSLNQNWNLYLKSKLELYGALGRGYLGSANVQEGQYGQAVAYFQLAMYVCVCV